MRGDAGVDGDAQRIAQLTWLLFLKVYDAAQSIRGSGSVPGFEPVHEGRHSHPSTR